MTEKVEVPIHDELEPQSFVLNVKKTPESSSDPEIQAALDWYHERLRLLPELKVTDFFVTDGEKWRGTITPEGQVQDVQGAQFAVKGLKAELSNFSWNQPYIAQGYELAEDTDGEEIKVSGIVIIVTDPEGKVLLSAANEPKAKEKIIDGVEKHPVIRTPIQTSVTKLKQLEAGEEKADPILFAILNDLAQVTGKDLRGTVKELEVKPPTPDGNRLESYVYYGELPVTADRAKELAEKTGGMFLSKKQRQALEVEINGHAHNALDLQHS